MHTGLNIPPQPQKVNESEPIPHQHFFCWVKDLMEGPFDLVELAGQLKQSIIGPETLICRDGEELWIEFGELPEFASAQSMSVEMIARHLEERIRAQHSPKARIAHFPWLVAAIATCVLVVVGLTTLFAPVPHAEMAPSTLHLPAADPWPRTEGEHFSIRCPVPMNAYFGEFRALVDGNQFRAGGTKLPDVIEPSDHGPVDSIRDYWVGIQGQHVTVDHVIEVNGHYGREVLYSKVVGSQSFVCGIRAVTDGRYLIFVMASLKSSPSSNADIVHYLTSLEVH